MLEACAGNENDTDGAAPLELLPPQLQSAEAPAHDSNVLTVARVYLMELLVGWKSASMSSANAAKSCLVT
jgi:hypothetical protein